MRREDFMIQLEMLLQNISAQEREDALQYYADYFDDAGPEQEEQIIEELGSPAKVAENIKRNIWGDSYTPEYESGYMPNGREVIKYEGIAKEQTVEKDKLSTSVIVWLVILAVLSAPIWLPVLCSLFCVLLALLIAWFSVIIAFGSVAVAFLAVLFVLFIVGIMSIGVSGAASSVIFGCALVFGGIGALFLLLTVFLVGKVTPAIFKGIAFLFRKLFRKN